MKLSWYSTAFITFRLINTFRLTKQHYENKTGAKFVVVTIPFIEVTFIDNKVAKKILVAEFFDNEYYIANLAYFSAIEDKNKI